MPSQGPVASPRSAPTKRLAPRIVRTRVCARVLDVLVHLYVGLAHGVRDLLALSVAVLGHRHFAGNHRLLLHNSLFAADGDADGLVLEGLDALAGSDGTLGDVTALDVYFLTLE